MSELFNATKPVFDFIRSFPTFLSTTRPTTTTIKTRLHAQGTNGAQGTGNQVTDQEASFAEVLEQYGFTWIPKGASVPVSDGFYYFYQVNGTQQSIDFQVFQIAGGAKTAHINLDLKHTLSDVFFLNDGWFHDDVVYVVSWQRKISAPRKRRILEPATFIGLGSTIPTAEESAHMATLQEIKAKLNTDQKGVGSLFTYIRFANRYSCARFTPEYTDAAYASVSSSLSASVANDGASSV